MAHNLGTFARASLLALLIATSAEAQSLSGGYFHYPYANLKQAGDTVGELQVSGQQVEASYLLALFEGWTRIESTLAYRRLQFDYRGIVHPMSSVQSIDATAFLRQRLSKSWGLIAVVAPGYASDFHGEASVDAITLMLIGAGSYRFSDGFEVGLGVALSDVFGEPLVMPVASVDWKITKRLWLEAILPVSFEITWLPIDQLGLRATLVTQGSNYHGDPNRYGVTTPRMKYSAILSELGVRWFILPWLHVTAHGGWTLFRRFIFADGDTEVDGGTFELANGPVFGFDLGLGR